jgi:hypothetical protein
MDLGLLNTANENNVSRRLASRSQSRGRRAKYRVTNSILEKGGRRFFVKTAGNTEAQAFLVEILRREMIAEEFFRGRVKVVRGNLEGGSIYYPLLELPTLESLIAELIMEGEDLGGLELICEYINMIESFPSEQCRPTDFMREFGIEEGEIAEPLNCLLVGPIDLIPSNILVAPEAWHIIDHEWTFEFPVPEAFIIYRGVYSLMVRIQKELQSCTSIHQPVVLFCGFGKNRTYIPLSWLKLIHSLGLPLERLAHWEFLFQNKVGTEAKLIALRVKEKSKTETSMKTVSCWIQDLVYMHSIFKEKVKRVLR